MTRRRLLLRAATGVAALGAAAIGGRAWWQARPHLGAEEAERLASILERAFGGPGVRELGAAYLEATPGESGRRALVSRLCGGWSDAERAAAPAAVAARVRRQHEDDFGAGRTAIVRGWVLSRTEARVGALAALR